MQRRQWVGLGVAAVAAGVWIALSPIHAHHNADSLVAVLVSLWRWTPFYWEQDRFGMLVPLLALPWRDPFSNLLVQTALRGAAVVLACGLLARAVMPRGPWLLVGAAASSALLAAKDLSSVAFVLMQPYAIAVALTLGALALLEAGEATDREPNRDGRAARGAWRLSAGLLLLLLASWVAVSTVLWLLPLLALREALGVAAATRRPAVRRALPAVAALACVAASAVAGRFAAGTHTEYAAAPVAAWPRAWMHLGRNLLALLGPAALVLVCLALAVALIAALRGSPRGRHAAAAAAVLIGTALVELLALGASGWVHRNELRPRFQLVGAAMLALVPLVVAAILALEDRPPRWRRLANAAALLLLAAALLWRCGWPSTGVARAALERLPSSRAHEALAAGATHVIGDYWLIWPTAFHAEVLLAEAGARRHLWAIGYRAEPTASRWRPPSWCAVRLLGLGSAADVEAARRGYRLPPLSGRCPELIARSPTPAGARASLRRPQRRSP